MARFQSTPLIRGATFFVSYGQLPHSHFNPRPSYEERPKLLDALTTVTTFQSTPLIRGATWQSSTYRKHSAFQSTPLIRGATFRTMYRAGGISDFNPRPSYEERLQKAINSVNRLNISIHAPHTRSDASSYPKSDGFWIFQSTPLIRGATVGISKVAFSDLYFNPRPSYEERLFLARLHRLPPYFNPRPSYEERRRRTDAGTLSESISIHAPHTRSDHRMPFSFHLPQISIHAPHTRSDGEGRTDLQAGLISIHAPHTRSDKLKAATGLTSALISIHAPHTRSDLSRSL